jgi:hypothetical protein
MDIVATDRTDTQARLIGLLWTRDRPVAETSGNTQHSQETDIQDLITIWTRNPSSEGTQTYAFDDAANKIGFEEIFVLSLPRLGYTISSAHVPCITR